MNLTTQRLIIRAFDSADKADVIGYMSDPDVTHFLSEGTLDESGVEHFILNTNQAFAIEHSASEKVIGHIEFYPWFGDHTYEMGWVLNPQFQGLGIALEAAQATLSYGFLTLGIHRVVATAQPENPASYKLMEKLGMVREGHFRQCIPKENGVWWDEYFYSILRSDFDNANAR